MAAARPPTRLAEHDTALHSLLESLLTEVPSGSPNAVAAADPAPEPAMSQPVVETASSRAATAVLQSTESAPPAADKLNAAPLAPLVDGKPARSAVPSWAETTFRALLFRVGDYRFALPLVLMRGVAVLEQAPHRVPGQAAWHLGIAHSRGTRVTLVELGLLVGVDARCRGMRYLLLLGDGQWALACDAIEEAVLVDSDDVRWHRGRDKRAWLAGFLVQQMCVLLDGEALYGAMRHG